MNYIKIMALFAIAATVYFADTPQAAEEPGIEIAVTLEEYLPDLIRVTNPSSAGSPPARSITQEESRRQKAEILRRFLRNGQERPRTFEHRIYCSHL